MNAPALDRDDEREFWMQIRRCMLRIAAAQTIDDVRPAAKALAVLIEQRFDIT